jgi:hypothetical protein
MPEVFFFSNVSSNYIDVGNIRIHPESALCIIWAKAKEKL